LNVSTEIFVEFQDKFSIHMIEKEAENYQITTRTDIL